MAKEKIEKCLRRNFFYGGREWPYKNVNPRIIAEQYMEDVDVEGLPDYKVHNFNGVPKVILVCRDRFKNSGLLEDFYSDNWEHIDVQRSAHSNGNPVNRPAELDEILEVSRKLSKNIPFVRTDFYTIKNKVYFGEITFFPASGFEAFVPEDFDYEMGSWIRLPKLGAGGGEVILNKNNMYILVQIINNKQGELKDYKFFCFDGKVKCFKVDFNRFTKHGANYYDTKCNLLPFGEVECPPNPKKKLVMPQEIPQMIELAEKLSKDFPFARIDFYDVNNKVYFGEITFFPASGFGKFEPEEWDTKIGGWLKLPK